jgi:hypothetical protein
MNLKNAPLTKKKNSILRFLGRGMDAIYINDIDQDIVKNNYIQNIIVNWV